MMNKPKAYSYIRFSTPEQLKGDSLRRQQEASEQYAKEKGLTLDTSINMQDLGLSAFTGKNRTKGALGVFLKLVEQGKIPKGSILIVENLDRISREQVLDALNQFTSIIKAGITLITLQDGMEYSQESINKNWAQLIISIAFMARAHEESLSKSKRLSSTWKNKREKAKKGKILTNNTPLWLSAENNKFQINEKAVQAIKLIYELRLQGFGTPTICFKMNTIKDGWKPPVSSKNKNGGFTPCYVIKLLYDKRLIGELQLHNRVDGKQNPIDEPIKDYFPKVLNEKLFFAVQELNTKKAQKPGKGGGLIGKANNLFATIIKCGVCGGSLHYVQGNSNGYLQCDYSRRKIQDKEGKRMCHTKPIRYDNFLQIIFRDLEELDISQITTNGNQQKLQIQELQNEIDSLNYHLQDLKHQQKNLIEEIGKENDGKLRQALKSHYNKLDLEIEELEAKIKESNNKLNDLRSNGANIKQGINQAKDIFSLLQAHTNDEQGKIELRLRLREIIRRIIKEVEIHPLENRPKKVPYKQEIEPGIIQWTTDKQIKKIIIRFNGSQFKARILQLQGYSEVIL